MFRFRIGTKLALAGGIGLLLVGAIAVNDTWDRRVRTTLVAEANRVVTVQTSALDAAIASRRLVIMGRDIRLAQVSSEVDDVLKRANGFASTATRALDAAAAAETSDVRQRIGRANDLVRDYLAAVTEIAAARKDVLERQLRLGEQGLAWAKDVGDLLVSRELVALSNSAEVAHVLERADFHNASSRAALWAYLTRGAQGAQGARERLKERLDNSTKSLKQARSIVEDPAIAKKIDALLGFAPRYQETVDQTLKASEHLATVVKDQADKTRVDLDKTLDDTVAEMTARAADVQGRIVAEEVRSQAIGRTLDVVVVLILLGSIVFSYVGVSRPIMRLNGAMDQMAKGNLAIDVPGTARGDEIGHMAKTISVIRENAAEDAARKQEATKRDEVARASHRKANMQQLASEFEITVGSIVETVSTAATELEASASTLTKSADTTQKLSVVVSEASEEASANVQSVATATEQMTSSITEISRQVQESSRIAGEAVKHAQKTDARVTALSEAASRIGDVVRLITAIAEQTNLLALNATIEAARAGAAGKGFAVVAQEVKALASQTAKATDEISSQIKGMQAATEESVSAIKEIGGIIGRISEIGATIAAAVEQQGSATQEIARNVQHASQGTAQVAVNITDVNSGAAETGSASTQVLSSARSLASESNRLKLEMAKFLETVRAA